MSQNPYETCSTSQPTSQTRPTQWMILTGCILLGLAAACLLTTVAMIMWSVDQLENSSTTLDPSRLASRINTAIISSVAMVPLGSVGIVFLIVGFVRRQPVNTA